ncbi:MAG: hypothetical protein QMD36_01135 [Candidatus Aenigmarchaeota archaeon]|nr:hypothetical protein [Candidatus Aenigmarchaeota archaeon]
MYEPYGEKRRLKIDWESLKEKIKSLKLTKTIWIIIAVIAIAAVSGITGYVSYTLKVTELNSKILIKEKQMIAVQNNLTSCLTDLDTAKGNINTLQTENTQCKVDLQNKETELKGCNSEKERLNADLAEMKSTMGEWKSKYEDLEDRYEILKNTRDSMERNYARGCCNFGFSYYFVKDGTKVICCSRKDVNSCGEVPENLEMIKEITC